MSKKKRRRNRHKQQEDQGGQGDELLVNGVVPVVPMATKGTPASLNDEGDDGRLSSNAHTEDEQIERRRGNLPEDEKPHDEPTGNLGEKLEQGKTDEEREEDQRSRLEDKQGEHDRDEAGKEETEDGEELLGYLEGEAIEENDGM